MIQELKPGQLRRAFDPAALGCETTASLKPLEGIIGQRRAVAALSFGLGIPDLGYNIFVAGPPGIGKMTAVQSYLEASARKGKTPPDWCYVENFADPYQPVALRLPPGQGRELAEDMKVLIEDLKRDVPRAFDSEEYAAKRDEVVQVLDRQRAFVRERITGKAAEAGFSMESTPLGVLMVPVVNGKPLGEEEFDALPVEKKAEIQKRREGLQEDLKAAMKEMRWLERQMRDNVQALDQQIAKYVVGQTIEEILDKYRELPDVSAWLDTAQKQILENIATFRSGGAPRQAPGPGGPGAPGEGGPPAPWPPEMPFRRFQVNLLVDNAKKEGAPVVVELNPSFTTLFGRFEKETHYGALYTDYLMIKPGSLHRANGGYLVLPAEDLIRNLMSWDGLKRALRAREIQIEELAERLGFLTTKSLRPQPIPLDVKIVLVGRAWLYYLLHGYDEEFPELFKVKAEFDTRTDLTPQAVQDFLSFLGSLCGKEGLRHLDGGGLARVLEHAARLADDQEKLSTHFGALADVVREANHWAGSAGADQIGAAHVRRALEEKVYRSALMEERLREMIVRGTILIDTTGSAVGQVNGLSVIMLGDHAFGKPSRVTATVGPGRGAIVDIEREVELGGPIHSKGVLILGGYLARTYAQDRPLALAARLGFEQSYEGVEGDSASSTELYAILSALSGLPVRQGIAVTGSVNQRGEVQAIGGANQKIEGFFDVCRARGLTGEQGAMLPASNVQNLMLREDVVEAVRAGKFRIWAVETIDDGIEVLTGVPAGRRGPDGAFPPGTVHALAEARLQAFGETLKSLSAGSAEAGRKD